MTSDPIQVALRVADALESCGLLYLVGGSLASSVGGEPRTTLDVDMVVSMTEGDIDCVLAALGSDFYADAAAIRRAVQQRSSVSVIHQPSKWLSRAGVVTSAHDTCPASLHPGQLSS